MVRLRRYLNAAPRGGPLRVATTVVTVLVVLSCVAAGWYGVSWYRAAHDSSLDLAQTRDTVLRSAQQAAINLNTMDHRSVERGLDLWEQSATGDVLEEFRDNRDGYAQAITEARLRTEATVVDGAVAELDDRAGTARVLIGLDVTVIPDQGERSVARQRLHLEMRRTEAGWKVHLIAPIGSPGAVPQGGGQPPIAPQPSSTPPN